MRHQIAILRYGFMALLLGLLVACSEGDSGRLTLGITDAPVDEADNVYVQFDGVEIQPSDGERIIINYFDDADPPNSTTKTLDLLSLQDGLREFLLDGHTLPAGKYSWLRLMVNAEADGVKDSYIALNGEEYELRVPSGSETGLKIVHPFEVPVNTEVDLTIDFDLRKSVHAPMGETYLGVQVYILRPTLRMVATSVAGYIHGSVDTAVFTGLSCSAPESGYFVYIYTGAGMTADDIDGDGGDPVTTAKVKMDSEGVYVYRSALLYPGDYTVSVTCEGNNDAPLADDAIVFVGTSTVTVVDGEGTVHDF